MQNLDELLKSEQAAKLMKDTRRLEQLKDSPESQRLFQLLDQSAGGKLEQAAGQAAQGDTASLMSAIRQLMENPEGQTLIRQMRQRLK